MPIASTFHTLAPRKPGKPRASAVVWRPRGGQVEFLVVTCANRPGRYTLPGGKIDPGESAPQAALRETREEAGVCAFAQRCLGSYEHRKRGQRVYPTRVYLARYQADTSPDEQRTRRWLTIHELDRAGIKLRDDARKMIGLASWHFNQQLQAA